ECLFQMVQQATHAERKGLQATYDELLLELNDDQLSQKAMARIMDFADKKKRRLILIVENLNTLFNEIPGPQQDDVGWKLRHTLQNEPRIMLLASATSRFEQIDHSGKALFELFRTIQLKPLKTQECSTLWQQISGKPSSHGTVRAIEILTGGSPRLISIVAKFGAQLSLNELLNELLDLVDDHTEYFKSHLENLPPKERRVYLALADLWIPATAKEIATRARQDIRSCSALLNRLISRGVVVEDENSKPRRKLYYLNERMYNIYYLLRRRRRPDAMVTALLRFMTAIYPRQQLLEIGHKLVSDCCTPTGKEFADINCMAYAGLYNHLEKEKNLLLDKTPWTFKDSQEIELQESVARALDNKGVDLRDTGNLKEAITCLEKAITFFERSGHPGRSLISKLSRACCVAEDGNHKESLEYMEDMFRKWPDNEADLPLGMFIEWLLEYIIITDSDARILAMIQTSRAAELLQPLITALKLELGQETRVSVEVREVAADIQKKLAQMRKALKDDQS
ncbi:MAG: tetratricopeptide repeat protein, partial [Proteobacteria bacterium]|nr:tetratricopeptide repeat protein [Pseudomonadota bacterium]